MSLLKAFQQRTIERKRYTIGYERWMDAGELLFDHTVIISPVTSPALIAEDAFASDADTRITFFIKGGVAGQTYLVNMIATTTEGQVKSDTLQMAVI